MADIKSQEARSKNMSKIRSKDTAPEEYIRKKLFARGYRYYKNVKTVSGHPDVWLPKYSTALFVNGCFWHRHKGCKYAYMPKSRVEFWTEKFCRNIERDKKVRKQLSEQKIRILIIWECTIKKMTKSEEYEKKILDEIEEFLHSEYMYMEKEI